MTNNLGFGFDAELDYRQERLRVDFRRTHGSNRPRWWQHRPAEAVVAYRTPTPERALHSVDAGSVNVAAGQAAPVTVEAVVVGHRAGTANSADRRANAA